MEKYEAGGPWRLPDLNKFDEMVAEITKLHPKYLQITLDDLKSNSVIQDYVGNYRKRLIEAIEVAIFERQVLK